MEEVPDKIAVFCGDKKLYDSEGLAYGKGEIKLKPDCNTLKVVVEGSVGTTWRYVVECPK
jgi:hypothetical protein